MSDTMYHYTECGLANVWLENGFVSKDTAYGKAIAIEAADDLHKLLAIGLVEKKGRLTGKELRFLRVQMSLSQAGLATMQGVTEQAVSLWERTGRVPKANDTLVRYHYLAHFCGQTPIAKAIERVRIAEQLVHQRIVAKKTTKRWSSTACSEDAAVCG